MTSSSLERGIKRQPFGSTAKSRGSAVAFFRVISLVFVGSFSLTSEENGGVLGPEFGASAPGIQREALLPSIPSSRFAAAARFQARKQDAKRPPAINQIDLPRTGEHKSPHERYFKIPRLRRSERLKRVVSL
jgi:hypothetical protein